MREFQGGDQSVDERAFAADCLFIDGPTSLVVPEQNIGLSIRCGCVAKANCFGKRDELELSR